MQQVAAEKTGRQFEANAGPFFDDRKGHCSLSLSDVIKKTSDRIYFQKKSG